jgi:hypothetical protein
VMKTFAVALIAGSALILPSAARAERITPRTAPVSFSLSVAGTPDPGTTFWVSYGPLAGKFAVVRLHPEGANTYGVRLRLPAGGHGTFYYLTGHGTMKSRSGPVPGDPVATIKRVGPVTLSQGLALRASWYPPLG